MAEDQKKETKVVSTRFQPGKSGNPAGRPKGSKNKTTLIKQAIEGEMVERLADDAMSVLEVTIQKAKEGDTGCIKLLLERLLPIRKANEDLDRVSTGGINIVINSVGGDNKETTIEGEIIEQKEEQ